jgi:predicted DNA-binding transcriptional regulator AlpA
MPKPTPIWWQPLGLSAGQAAAHLGISRTKFDELVKDGRMPQPHCVDGRRLWDRREVEECFAMLPRESSTEKIEPWGQMEV